MYKIDNSNIVPFIAQLYKEKKGGEAPEALLNSWKHLSDEEIENNLKGLFESWGLTEKDKEIATQRFLNRFAQSSSQAVNNQSSTNYFTTENAVHKRKNLTWLWIVFIILGLIGIYVGFQYFNYNNLTRVYAITDNVVIRNEKGNVSGRMDLFQKENLENSYTNLRLLDKNVVYKKAADSDKEYPTYRVIMDSITFRDYFFNKSSIAHYVNINYLVEDKSQFNIYQNAFKEIKEVKTDNDRLFAAIRKVIVGSIARTPDMQHRFLLTNSKGLNTNIMRNTSPFISQEIVKDKHYVVIAALDDGNFYRFEGDIYANVYEPLKPVYYVFEDGQKEALSGGFRFIRTVGGYHLYNTVQKESTYYQLQQDASGKNEYFQLNAPQPINIDTTNNNDSAVEVRAEAVAN